MEVKEFFSLIDALRFDTSVDEQNPELRGLLQRYYPILRKIYNMLSETGMIVESHGAKKHKGPKDEFAAMRKGNREADQEMFGGGFRQTKKIHKAKNDKVSKKVDLNNLDRYDESKISLTEDDMRVIVSESVKRLLKEMDWNEREYRLDAKPFQDNENKNIIYHAAYGEIDYLYNEGVIAYNNKNLCVMAERPIGYCELIKCMLHDFGTKLDNEAGQMLRNYYNLSKRYGETIPDVEEAINLAVKDFVRDGNCCNLVDLGF